MNDKIFQSYHGGSPYIHLCAGFYQYQLSAPKCLAQGHRHKEKKEKSAPSETRALGL